MLSTALVHFSIESNREAVQQTIDALFSHRVRNVRIKSIFAWIRFFGLFDYSDLCTIGVEFQKLVGDCIQTRLWLLVEPPLLDFRFGKMGSTNYRVNTVRKYKRLLYTHLEHKRFLEQRVRLSTTDWRLAACYLLPTRWHQRHLHEGICTLKTNNWIAILFFSMSDNRIKL